MANDDMLQIYDIISIKGENHNKVYSVRDINGKDVVLLDVLEYNYGWCNKSKTKTLCLEDIEYVILSTTPKPFDFIIFSDTGIGAEYLAEKGIVPNKAYMVTKNFFYKDKFKITDNNGLIDIIEALKVWDMYTVLEDDKITEDMHLPSLIEAALIGKDKDWFMHLTSLIDTKRDEV